MNNLKMGSIRMTPEYEALMADLYLIGAIPKNVAEALCGHKIASNLVLPDNVIAAIEDSKGIVA
jgi:hypothetical protein